MAPIFLIQVTGFGLKLFLYLVVKILLNESERGLASFNLNWEDVIFSLLNAPPLSQFFSSAAIYPCAKAFTPQ